MAACHCRQDRRPLAATTHTLLTEWRWRREGRLAFADRTVVQQNSRSIWAEWVSVRVPGPTVTSSWPTTCQQLALTDVIRRQSTHSHAWQRSQNECTVAGGGRRWPGLAGPVNNGLCRVVTVAERGQRVIVFLSASQSAASFCLQRALMRIQHRLPRRSIASRLRAFSFNLVVKC